MTARATATSRQLEAGCRECHGEQTHWSGPNAQASAARHHDSTGHPTWCNVALSICYGATLPDDRQIDIEDVIAGCPS